MDLCLCPYAHRRSNNAKLQKKLTGFEVQSLCLITPPPGISSWIIVRFWHLPILFPVGKNFLFSGCFSPSYFPKKMVRILLPFHRIGLFICLFNRPVSVARRLPSLYPHSCQGNRRLLIFVLSLPKQWQTVLNYTFIFPERCLPLPAHPTKAGRARWSYLPSQQPCNNLRCFFLLSASRNTFDNLSAIVCIASRRDATDNFQTNRFHHFPDCAGAVCCVGLWGSHALQHICPMKVRFSMNNHFLIRRYRVNEQEVRWKFK